MVRQNISGGGKWEPIVGYSRAVRVGNSIFVAGTTAAEADGSIVGKGDPYAQAIFVFRKIEKALHEAGAGLDDVVRTRMFLTNIEHWQEVGRAHKEVFGEIRPGATMIGISRLVDPEMLVEIEVDAVKDNVLP